MADYVEAFKNKIKCLKLCISDWGELFGGLKKKAMQFALLLILLTILHYILTYSRIVDFVTRITIPIENTRNLNW
jgi:hypothetical protein